jgi:hypothetical protein
MGKVQKPSNCKSIADSPNGFCIQFTGSEYFYVTTKTTNVVGMAAHFKYL